jgi:Dyp-type peroxidase family
MTQRPPFAPEPLLDVDDIQGNILAGFNKDHQILLLLEINDVTSAKRWLAAIQGHIASTAEVLVFNRLRKAVKLRRDNAPSGFVATWVNIAFSHAGLTKLTTPAETAGFSDAFTQGLGRRSGLIFDPTDPTQPGHPSRWEFGGTAATTPDVLLIFAGDDPAMLGALVERWRSDLAGFVGDGGAPALSEVAPAQHGDTLGGALNGHEHFGFRDGISQPGIRGRVSDAPDDFLTPRSRDPASPEAGLFGKPGQRLVWPGQFVLGLPRQDDENEAGSVPALDLDPAWTANGSFLVLRKLEQNVPAFWASMRSLANDFPGSPPPGGAAVLASRLIGRWPSGAPVMRTPNGDVPALAQDERLSNDFGFRNPTPPLRLPPGTDPPAAFPPAVADPDGAICPLAGHIRKVNPRDDPTDQSGATDTLTRLVLRRGVPYGLALPDPQTSPDDGAKRGLLFVCYQGSIEAQFEFLMSTWVNQIAKPRPGGGRDALLGRHTIAPPTFVMLPGPDGTPGRIPLAQDWTCQPVAGISSHPRSVPFATVSREQTQRPPVRIDRNRREPWLNRSRLCSASRRLSSPVSAAAPRHSTAACGRSRQIHARTAPPFWSPVGR